MKQVATGRSSGVPYMLMSTFSFALMNVFIKKVSNIPPMEIVFVRCFVSMILCFAIIFRDKTDWKGSNRQLLILRGVFGTIALYTFFVTLHNMPLGTAVTIQYLSPIFTTIIAIFLLKEKVKAWQWLFFCVSFAGVLVIKGFDNRISLAMLAMGIASALASGFAYNMVRSLKEKEPTMVVVLHFQLIGVLVGLTFSIFQWRAPTAVEWVYLILIGVCTQLGQVNLTKALQREKIADISILNYLGIIYSLIFGFTVFGEHYPLLTIAGIVLVLGGVCANFFYQKFTSGVVAEEELTTVEE